MVKDTSTSPAPGGRTAHAFWICQRLEMVTLTHTLKAWLTVFDGWS